MVLGLHSGLCRSWGGGIWKDVVRAVESGVRCFSRPKVMEWSRWTDSSCLLPQDLHNHHSNSCGNLIMYKGAVNAFCLSTTIILLLHRTEPWSWLRGQSFYPHTALDKAGQILQSPKSTHGSATAQLNKKRKWQKDSTPSVLCWEQEPPFLFSLLYHRLSMEASEVPHPHWQPAHWFIYKHLTYMVGL